MVPSRFKRGDRVVGIGIEDRAHPGVIETVWRRLDHTIYGVRFDKTNQRLRVIESDLRLETEFGMT